MVKIPKASRRGRPLDNIRAEFGRLEIVDATEPLRLQPGPCDVIGAVQKDPTSCVFAKCARRMFGSEKVLFWKTSAYIDLVGPDGIRRVNRFLISAPMIDLAKSFDRGEPFDEGRAFILRPPTPSNTLERQRLAASKRLKTKNGRILAKAQIARAALRKAKETHDASSAHLRGLKAEKRPDPVKLERAKASRRESILNLRRTREAADRAWRAASRVSSRPLLKPGQPQTFDLTRRTGRGHYTFKRRSDVSASIT